MKEVALHRPSDASESTSFRASLATILELPLDAVPEAGDGAGMSTMRWLGGMALGLVEVADVNSFSWAGPWIGMVRPPGAAERRAVVMFGVPSGVVWDPTEATRTEGWLLETGYVVGALDVALAMPPATAAATGSGIVESINVASAAGKVTSSLESVDAIAGQGLQGDRHVTGDGTFPSGSPGSAMTLIEAEVCESFDPPLTADEHRRNLVTRGIELNGLVSHEFTVGDVRCRGIRLCEPCTVVDRYSTRPLLRPLVHRGGLRADILADGPICVGDRLAIA